MGDPITLFGTDAARPSAQRFNTGRLSFELLDGGLHDIRFDNIEVIRAVTFPVRDRDWGTIGPRLDAAKIEETATGLTLAWNAEFVNGGARLRTSLVVTASGNHLEVHATARSDGDFETNRAGFTVLHPIAASACPLTVEHSDGTAEDSHLPDRIEPWQPFMDIRTLTHTQSGVVTRCQLRGDVFEMEDQRQWSDASFKTYNRPLAWPWPYRLRDGETLQQSVSLSFTGEGQGAYAQDNVTLSVGALNGCRIPELALVVTPAEARELLSDVAPLERIGPQRITAHVDPETDDTDLAPFAQLRARLPLAVDLEYAARCDGDLDSEFTGLAEQIQAANLPISSLFVCPSVDRQSTPPGSSWPDCPPLEDVHAAAARAFPNIPRGGGMLSYFTEFNRKRPPVGMLDFVAHGTNPIVHAADDRSVMQTLTALPWILRSGQAIADGKLYRLGLSSIPMRQNPYGSRTIDNPENQRVCMGNSDPRHFAQFGAAFTLGYLAQIAPFGIEVWTPAAGSGPRGVCKDGNLTPLGDLLSCLSRLAGQPVRNVSVSEPEKAAALATEKTLLLANFTDGPIRMVIENGGEVRLGPYAIAEHPLSGPQE